MASYTTSLRLVQPATGEYSGTWGTQVNTGLTALLDASIAGAATITMTAANYTLSTANGASDESRAMFLVLGGTPGASYQVICPAVSKLYFVTNNTGFAQTVKTASGSGVSVPNGAKIALRCDGADVVEALNYFGSLTVGPLAAGAVTAGAIAASSLSLTTQLSIPNGGTGATSFTANNVLLGNGASSFQTIAPGSSGNVLTSNGTTWQSAAPAVPVAVTSISFDSTGLTPNTATTGAVTVAGTLNVANGGTGLSSLTANNVILGNGTSAVQVVAPSTNGNLLTSNGTTWVSAAPSTSIPVNLQEFSSSGTWTKPAGATFVMVQLWAGGGSGGSGSRGSSSNYNFGGGGGGSGGYATFVYAASALGSTETVTIGVGGSGGAAVTTNDTNGNAGAAGGNSTFSNLIAVGGGAGGAGVGGGGAAINIGSGIGGPQVPTATTFTNVFPGTGGTFTFGTTTVGYKNTQSGGGGGSGGAISSGAIFHTATAGGGVTYDIPLVSGSAPTGGGGAVDTNGGAVSGFIAGTGGGGGSASVTGAANAGGNGGVAAGGGGGGPSLNGSASGKGGNGGNGYARIFSW